MIVLPPLPSPRRVCRCQDGSTVVPWSSPARPEDVESLQKEQFDVTADVTRCLPRHVPPFGLPLRILQFVCKRFD